MEKKKHFLKNMHLNSVDLCRQGANGEAHIKLYKSADMKGGETGMKETLWDKLRKALGEVMGAEPSDEVMEAVEKAVGSEVTPEQEAQIYVNAMGESLHSILMDSALTDEERADLLTKSMDEFADEINKAKKRWFDEEDKREAEMEENQEIDDIPDDESDLEKGKCKTKKSLEGADTMNFDIAKMSEEDKATLEALQKKYSGEEEKPEMHPEVKKALEEMETLKRESAELKKSLEIKELEGVAKKYEILGKNPTELAPKLYDLKKAGDSFYNDYVALLDEQANIAKSGIFKEFGSNKSGAASDLNGIVAEIMKSEPTMTREQAVIKAYETNPNLDPFTGENK